MNLQTVLSAMPDAPDYELHGNMEFEHLSTMEGRTPNGVLSFLLGEKYTPLLNEKFSVILTTEALAKKVPAQYGLCITPNPKHLFCELHNYLSTKEEYRRPDHPSKIGQGCCISPHASVAERNVVIGDNVIIEEFVVVREHTVIMDNSIIRSGAVIGGTGFFPLVCDDSVGMVSHIGGTILGRHTEIQHMTIIDRATYPWDNTVIGDYVKMDNMIHIGHAVHIGARTRMAAGSTLSGRVTIGDDSWVGVGCLIRNGITIGNGTRINMGAVVTKDVPDGQAVTGNFAIEHGQFMRNFKKSLVE